ncbi:hypothetical protein T484DRAFT_1931460 [Baffinella frigidus]|nr:hypothetical protein T484DRAFT_1931460 [Cryptophyta sp. CCMP2293]
MGLEGGALERDEGGEKGGALERDEGGEKGNQSAILEIGGKRKHAEEGEKRG